MKDLIIPTIPSKDSTVLIVGCGNSNFSSDLYDCGYHYITNIDYSHVVIEKMKVKNMNRAEMKWIQMDMKDMSLFHDNSFDVIIDKGREISV